MCPTYDWIKKKWIYHIYYWICPNYDSGGPRNMSGFVLNMTRFDLNITWYVLKVTELTHINITVNTLKYYWIFSKYDCI